MRRAGWVSVGLGVVTCLLLTAPPVQAQGWIEPPVLRGGFAVEKTRSDVHIRIDGRVALVEVSEWFANEGSRVAEGDYLYPLPGEAVFRGFSLFQGDDELRGEIMNADEARDIYERIVRRRADPALIELAGHGLLRARVFPIQPGEERKVTLRYTQVLERAGNALQLVYAGAVGNTAGPVSGEAPEARALPEPVETSFEIEVPYAADFLEPFSPTHELSVDHRGDRMFVSVDDEVVGRFSVFLPLAGEAVGLTVATHRPVGEDGYFMLTLSPDRVAESAEARDVTVVLDVSGSMSGDKIVQARQALHQLLGSLGRDDRFRLIAFSNAVRMQSAEWQGATGYELARAREWVDRLVADGGTDIGAALEEAFRLESPGDRLPLVVFLTDGLPSVGERSPQRLADRAEELAGRVRVFAFGVGYDVNTHLLDRLGKAGRGSTDYVQPGEDVERAIALLAAKIRHPVLTDLRLSGGPTRLTEVYPIRISDVFAGQELVLFGRFVGDGQGQITVEGARSGDPLDFSTELIFPEASDANAYIPRLWASRKLGHLERQIWTEGETAHLIDEIRLLGLRYGIPTRYTSYLVQEPVAVALMPADSLRRYSLRLMPAAAAAPAMQNARRAAAEASGARAVERAAQARQRRAARSVNELQALDEDLVKSVFGDRNDEARTVAGRIFRHTEGVWTDTGHVDTTEIVAIRAFGSAYFDLLRALPEIGPVLRELDRVLIGGEGVSIQVGDEGIDQMSRTELEELVKRFRGEG